MDPSAKRLLRQDLRRARRALTRAQQYDGAQGLTRRLLSSREFKLSQHIGFYWPADGEISPLPVLQVARHLGKSCYLPVVTRTGLVFREAPEHARLRANQYGIPEPTPNHKAVAIHQLDLVLVPLVGFDNQGNRLGMGAGFYDRAFADCNQRHPLRIGLAYELQKVEALPTDSWDVPLHAVFTERKSYHLSSVRKRTDPRF